MGVEDPKNIEVQIINEYRRACLDLKDFLIKHKKSLTGSFYSKREFSNGNYHVGILVDLLLSSYELPVKEILSTVMKLEGALDSIYSRGSSIDDLQDTQVYLLYSKLSAWHDGLLAAEAQKNN